jgi:hypothetical protein
MTDIYSRALQSYFLPIFETFENIGIDSMKDSVVLKQSDIADEQRRGRDITSL